MLTTSPEPCSTMPSIAAWVMYINPSTLVPSIRRQSSGSAPTIVPSSMTPALLTSTSSPLSPLRVRATASRQGASSVAGGAGVAAGRLAGDVECEVSPLGAPLAEPRGQAVEPVTAAGTDRHGGTRPGQGDGRGLADARRRAGDQGDPAGQTAVDLAHGPSSLMAPPRVATGCGRRPSLADAPRPGSADRSQASVTPKPRTASRTSTGPGR